MYFGGRRPVTRRVKIKDHVGEMVHNFEYLDIVLDFNLTFNGHVDHTCIQKSPPDNVSSLGKLRGFGVSCDVLETVYKSFVESACNEF